MNAWIVYHSFASPILVWQLMEVVDSRKGLDVAFNPLMSGGNNGHTYVKKAAGLFT